MKRIFLFVSLFFLSFGINAQTPVNLGNPETSSGSIDGWFNLLVVNETDTYTNVSADMETISVDGFNFGIGSFGGRVTPFLVRVNGDNDFTVIAIGKTRVAGVDYSAVGTYNLAFDDIAPTITLAPGETIATATMNANPDGSGVTGSVIPYNNVGDEVWITGESTSGTITLNNPIVNGASVFNGNRDYAFSIDLTVLPPAPIPTMSTWGVMILFLMIGIYGIIYLKRRSVKTSF